MAHAVVMHVKMSEDTSLEDSERMLKELVIPHAKSQPGFMHGTWMHDGGHDGMGVVVFATAENAEQAKDTLKPPPGGPELISVAVWEIGAEA